MVMSSSVYRQHLENFLAKLEVKEDRVLDVGGGSNPVYKRVHSWDVKEYAIMDNELESPVRQVDFIQDLNYPVPKIQERPYEDCDHEPHCVNPIQDMLRLEKESKFDVIFCLEVFDYIWNPVQACENLMYMLKPGGTLVVTFPFIYPNHNPTDADMLRYTRQGAEKLLNRAGFSIRHTYPRLMNHTAFWKRFIDAEGYRYRGASDAGTLWDAGYIITAESNA